MSNRTKKTYPKWLFWIEVLVIVGVYLSLLIPFRKYFFHNILVNHTVFIYVYLIIIGLAFVFFLITLLTGTYYSQKEKTYNTYRKKIYSLKKRGKYCSSLKYTISLIIGFSFFISILGISAMNALSSKDEISIVAAIISILGLLGFIKSVRSGSFYSLLSRKRGRKRKKKDAEANPVEDGIAMPEKKN